MRSSLRLTVALAVSLGAALVLTACGAQHGAAPGQVEIASGADPEHQPDVGSAAQPDTAAATAGAQGDAQDGAQPADGAPAADSGGDGAPAAAPGPLSERLADGRQTTDARAADDPVAVALPAIGVKSRLVRLGLDLRREMEVPDDFALAGWYTHAPKPGDVGPAVIVGHKSAGRGSAIFNDLHRLDAGDRVEVLRADGAVVVFVVDRVERHPKDAFPTAAVYGDTAGPELRLITCGGEFDRRAGSHLDNIVVFASAVDG